MKVFVFSTRQDISRAVAHELGIPPMIVTHLYHRDQLRGLRGATVLVHPTAVDSKEYSEVMAMARNRQCQTYSLVDHSRQWAVGG